MKIEKHSHTNEELIDKSKKFVLEELGYNFDNVVFMPIQYVELSEIEPFNADTESNNQYILELASLMSQGIAFPPIIIFKTKKLMMDGNHRYLASEYIKLTHIPVLYFIEK